MEITKLQIKNFLSVTDVEITPGKVTQISGRNNQGKTTILKAIEFALKGSTDGSLVKHGADQGEVVIEFDDSTQVRRTIRPGGAQDVKVRVDGVNIPKPQLFLNQLFHTSTFNPLQLLDKDSRTEALLKCIPISLTEADLKAAVGEGFPIPLPPLDYSQHGLKVVDQLHGYLYKRRAEINKIAKDKSQVVEVKRAELPEIPTLDTYDRAGLEHTIAVSRKQITAEESKSAVVNDRRQRVQMLERKMDDQQVLIDNAIKKISELERQLTEAKTRLSSMKEQREIMVAEFQEAVQQVETEGPDHEKISKLNLVINGCQEQITAIEKRDRILEQHKSFAALEADAKEAQLVADRVDVVVKFLACEFKEQLISKTDLPVTGLAYVDGQFTLEGSSIDNLASSKALRLAIALARKLAQDTKLICIDGAELLDADSYSVLRDEIKDDGFSYFITKVGEPFAGEGDKVVRMEGGQIQ